MSENMSKKKDSVNSSGDSSEVFVLPPQLLQKLGIHLNKVKDGTNVLNSGIYKEVPCIAKKKKKRYQSSKMENKSLNKHDSSSILETAQLMKSSVFLSPTFTANNDMNCSRSATKSDDRDDDVPLSALARQKSEINCSASTNTKNDSNTASVNQSNKIFKDDTLKPISNLLNNDSLLRNINNVSTLTLLERCLSKKPVSDIGVKLCSETMVTFDCNEVPILQAIQPMKPVDVDEAYGSDYANSNSGASGITDTEHEPLKMIHDKSHNLNPLESRVDHDLMGKVLSTEDFTLAPINMDDVLLMSDKDTEKMAVTFSDSIITETNVPVTSIPSDIIESQDQHNFYSENVHPIINQDLENAALLLNIAQILPEIDESTSSNNEPSSFPYLINSNELITQNNKPEKCKTVRVKHKTNNFVCGTESTISNKIIIENVQSDNITIDKSNTKDVEKIDYKLKTTDKVTEIASYLSKCAHLLQNRKHKINKNVKNNIDKKQGAEEPGGKNIFPSDNTIDASNILKTYKRTKPKPLACNNLRVKPTIYKENILNIDNNSNEDAGVKQVFCICSDFGHLNYNYLEDDLNQHIHYINKVTLGSDVPYQLCDINYIDYIDNTVMNEVEIKKVTTETSDFTQTCWASLPCMVDSCTMTCTDKSHPLENDNRSQIPVDRSLDNSKNVNKSVAIVQSKPVTSNDNKTIAKFSSGKNYESHNERHQICTQYVKINQVTTVPDDSVPNNNLSQNKPSDKNEKHINRSSPIITISKNTKTHDSCKTYDKGDIIPDTIINKLKSITHTHNDKNESINVPFIVTNTKSCIGLPVSLESRNQNGVDRFPLTYENCDSYTNQSRHFNLVEIKEIDSNHVPKNIIDACDINPELDSSCTNTFNTKTTYDDILNDIIIDSTPCSPDVNNIISNTSYKEVESAKSSLPKMDTIANDNAEKPKNIRKRRLKSTPNALVEKRTRSNHKTTELQNVTSVSRTTYNRNIKTNKSDTEKAIIQPLEINRCLAKKIDANAPSCSTLPNKTEKDELKHTIKCYNSPKSIISPDSLPPSKDSSDTDNTMIVKSLCTESTIHKDTFYNASTVSDTSKNVISLNQKELSKRKRKFRISSDSDENQYNEIQNKDQSFNDNSRKETQTVNYINENNSDFINEKNGRKITTINITSPKELIKEDIIEKKKVTENLARTSTNNSTNNKNCLTNGCIDDLNMQTDQDSSCKKIDNNTTATDCTPNHIDKSEGKINISMDELLKKSNKTKPNHSSEKRRNIKNKNLENSQIVNAENLSESPSASKASTSRKYDSVISASTECVPKIIKKSSVNYRGRSTNNIMENSIPCKNNLSKTSAKRLKTEDNNVTEMTIEGANQFKDVNDSSIHDKSENLVVTAIKTDECTNSSTPCRRSYSKSSDSETLITKVIRKPKGTSISAPNQSIGGSMINVEDKESNSELNKKITTSCLDISIKDAINEPVKSRNKRKSKINSDKNHSTDNTSPLATSSPVDNSNSDIKVYKPRRISNSKSSDSEPLLTKKMKNTRKSSTQTVDQFSSNINKLSNNIDVSDNPMNISVDEPKDNTVVKCCVCDESMARSQWYNHSGSQHLYKAWNDHEPAINLDDDNAVKKHILAISKLTNGLICHRCNFQTKFYSTFLNHLKTCIKKEVKKKLNESQKVDINTDSTEYGKNKVVCCICMKEIPRKQWTDHAMIEHYNVAWNNEEQPIDITVPRFIERLLRIYKSTFNKLECRICGSTRASALGFFAHVIACGKSDEEVDKFKETCDICKNKYLAIYRQQHYMTHKVKEQRQAELEERRKLAKVAREKSPEIVTPGKRRAAQKAINVISGVQKALSQSVDADGRKNIEDDPYNDSDSSVSVVLSELSESESDEYDENASDLDQIHTDIDEDEDDDEEMERRRKKKMPAIMQWRLGRIPFVIEDVHSYITQSIKQHFNSLLNIERVHTNWNNDFILVSDSEKQRYMNLLKESCNVKNGSQWSKYKPLEVRTNPVFSMFVGSSPRSVSWVPPTEGVKDDSYLIVSCYNSTDCPRYRCDDIYKQDTSIQIWNCHSFKTEPELAFCIAIDYGVVWSMDWCPTGARDNPDETDNPRLGLLAIACSDGNVYIMSIPHPSIFRREKPMIKPNPAVILRLSNSTKRKLCQASAVCWSKEKGHTTLMVGYADGTVAHYDVNTESPLLRTVENGIPVILPYQDEVVHSNCVTNVLSQWPSGLGGGVSCASSIGGVCMWSGRTLQSSQYLNISATEATFVPHWTSVFAAMEDRTASQNECEWFVGGRRIGCGRAVSACQRCGNFAIAHSPWISAMRPHPASPDLKRQTFAKIAPVPLSVKKPGGSNLDRKLEPLTYEDTVKKYGIELSFPKKNDQTEREYDIVPERFPLSEVSSIAYCPTATNHHMLAAATHAGIIFILNSPKIKFASSNYFK